MAGILASHSPFDHIANPVTPVSRMTTRLLTLTIVDQVAIHHPSTLLQRRYCWHKPFTFQSQRCLRDDPEHGGPSSLFVTCELVIDDGNLWFIGLINDRWLYRLSSLVGVIGVVLRDARASTRLIHASIRFRCG